MNRSDGMILSLLIIILSLVLLIFPTSCATRKPSKTYKVGVRHEAFLLPSNYY